MNLFEWSLPLIMKNVIDIMNSLLIPSSQNVEDNFEESEAYIRLVKA